MILSVIVLFYIAYITRNDFLAYLTASLGSILFISGQYCKGVSEEAIYAKVHLLRIRNLFIPKIPFEELEKIRIDEKKNT